MCIIAIKPKGKELFDDLTIRIMFFRNPDGAGLMYVDEGLVYYKKGFFDVEDLLEYLHTKDWTDKTLVLHFRIGTSGKKDELNCHPYPVYDENDVFGITDLAMVHNGVLRKYTPISGSKINDTQIFIHKVLRKLDKDFYKDAEKRFLIEELIGSNKLCFLDGDEKLTLIGNFIEDDGYLYSNYSYSLDGLYY